MAFWDETRRQWDELLREHGSTALLLVTLFLMGMIFGALALRTLDSTARLNLVSYLGDAFGALTRQGSPGSWPLFWEALWGKVKLLGLFWLLSVSLVGALGVLLLTAWRGFLSGFVVAFLAAELGGRGLLVAAAGHLPQTLLEVPAILLGGTAAVAFAVETMRTWGERGRLPYFYENLVTFTGRLLTTGLLLVAAAVAEGYLAPALVRAIAINLP